ncbi:MAG: hypothetical protein A2X18_07085 [Bacteroidetes bacterium GWF2_40_14]|nr:MAG: hypothetical protein A2X18_07085 [Bacteroidetes bacterium GWF2_40_14]
MNKISEAIILSANLSSMFLSVFQPTALLLRIMIILGSLGLSFFFLSKKRRMSYKIRLYIKISKLIKNGHSFLNQLEQKHIYHKYINRIIVCIQYVVRYKEIIYNFIKRIIY